MITGSLMAIVEELPMYLHCSHRRLYYARFLGMPIHKTSTIASSSPTRWLAKHQVQGDWHRLRRPMSCDRLAHCVWRCGQIDNSALDLRHHINTVGNALGTNSTVLQALPQQCSSSKKTEVFHTQTKGRFRLRLFTRSTLTGAVSLVIITSKIGYSVRISHPNWRSVHPKFRCPKDPEKALYTCLLNSMTLHSLLTTYQYFWHGCFYW